MGLMFRRRRPVARLAAGAATAGVAYHMGKKSEQQSQYNDQAQAAYESTQQQQQPQYAPPPQQYAAPAPAPAPAPAANDTTAELERLGQLHAQGILSDDEFSAAKAKVLGI